MEGWSKAVWVAGLLLPVAMLAQSNSPPVPRSQIRVTRTTVVQGMQASSTWSPLRCDSEGNVYVRFYDISNIGRAPVVRISADGEDKMEFSLAAAPDFGQSSVDAFAVAPDGEVALAIWGPKINDGHILMFKSDGTFDPDSSIKMGSRNTFQIAIFSNGNLLVSGTRSIKLYGKSEPSVSAPFGEVLNNARDVVKDFTLPGDYKAPKPSDAKFEESLKTQPPEITLGDAVAADDGNVYLARHFGDPIVYVIASDGTLVRRLRLEPPPRAGVYSSSIHYSPEGGGRLAIYSKGPNTPTGLVSIYDAETGKRAVDYELPRGLGSALACYSPNGFTFLGSNEQHQLAIKEARPY